MSNPPARLCLVLNPRGGGGRARGVLEQVRPALEECGVALDVRETRCVGHAREIARGLDAEAADALVVLGGDGTVHEVVNGLMARPDPAALPFGVIPAGSGNSLATDLGVLDPSVATQRILMGAAQPFDVLRVTGRGDPLHAFNIVGWGLAADVGRLAERWRALGPGRYSLMTVWSVLRGRVRSARLSVDGQTSEERLSFVMALNTRHTGTGMCLAPDARLDDGLLDLLVVRAMPRGQLLRLFSRVPDGGHLDSPHVEMRQVSRFSLSAPSPEPLNIDGEVAGSSPMEVSVLPGALRLLR